MPRGAAAWSPTGGRCWGALFSAPCVRRREVVTVQPRATEGRPPTRLLKRRQPRSAPPAQPRTASTRAGSGRTRRASGTAASDEGHGVSRRRPRAGGKRGGERTHLGRLARLRLALVPRPALLLRVLRRRVGEELDREEGGQLGLVRDGRLGGRYRGGRVERERGDEGREGREREGETGEDAVDDEECERRSTTVYSASCGKSSRTRGRSEESNSPSQVVPRRRVVGRQRELLLDVSARRGVRTREKERRRGGRMHRISLSAASSPPFPLSNATKNRWFHAELFLTSLSSSLSTYSSSPAHTRSTSARRASLCAARAPGATERSAQKWHRTHWR